MARPGRSERRLSASSSSSTSPEREIDDNDSFTMQTNDSQSSLALSAQETDMMEDSIDEEHERRCREIPVYRLPAEILISIFARLTSTRDLQSCMLVSRDWAKNSVGLLWHRPSTSHWNSVHSVVRSVRKVNQMFAYQDLVKRLNMSILGPQVSDGVLLGLSTCKRIERLTLTNCTKLTDQSMAPLLDGNRSLVALDATGMDGFTDVSLNMVANNCVRLQGLNVTQCRKITDSSVMNVARNCRQLKRLKFNHCGMLSDKSIITIASHSPNLLEIDLLDLPLVQSPSITHILESCQQLRELRLMKCINIRDAAFTSLSPKIAHSSLRVLDLTECQFIGDKAVERIVTACPRLRNLLLAKCQLLTDRAAYAITKLGKNLHYLHLGHCTRLTDEAIKAISRHCTRIRYIDLAGCRNLTDDSVIQLASNLPKLKRVGLVKCEGITDNSVIALATYGGRTQLQSRPSATPNVLERVHLSYCTQLTREGIHGLLNNCPRLTHLSLTGVQSFLRDDLTAFCREAPPEFNDHQRGVFCVYSGTGVIRLRDHLNRLAEGPHAMQGFTEQATLAANNDAALWARHRQTLLAAGILQNNPSTLEQALARQLVMPPPPLRPHEVLINNPQFIGGEQGVLWPAQHAGAHQMNHGGIDMEEDEDDDDVEDELDVDDAPALAPADRGAIQATGSRQSTTARGALPVFRPLPPVPHHGVAFGRHSAAAQHGTTGRVVPTPGNPATTFHNSLDAADSVAMRGPPQAGAGNS